MSIISLFCSIDDFCLLFEPEWHKQLISQNIKPPVCSRLSLSEVMTIVVHFHQSGYRNFKTFYTDHVLKKYASEFPELVSYNRFVELMPQALVPLTVFLKRECVGKPTGLSFIDATPITVCHNLRIASHRVFNGMAKRGKTSTGWKFGFKLHLIINHLGELLSFTLTPGNTDDRKPVRDLVGGLVGWLYGDKGYISQELTDWLSEKGLNLVTKVRKNMKPKLLNAFDKIMLRKRAVIESVNDQLKNISQIEHSRHRSPFNFAVNLVAGLIAYSLQPLKPHIDVDQLTQGLPMTI